MVATDGDEIVGHILLSPVMIESEVAKTQAIALGPMAAAPSRQRQGIGSKLVRAGLEERAKAGHVLVIVLGTPNTTCALDFDPQRILAFAGNMIARRRYLW